MGTPLTRHGLSPESERDPRTGGEPGTGRDPGAARGPTAGAPPRGAWRGGLEEPGCRGGGADRVAFAARVTRVSRGPAAGGTTLGRAGFGRASGPRARRASDGARRRTHGQEGECLVLLPSLPARPSGHWAPGRPGFRSRLGPKRSPDALERPGELSEPQFPQELAESPFWGPSSFISAGLVCGVQGRDDQTFPQWIQL